MMYHKEAFILVFSAVVSIAAICPAAAAESEGLVRGRVLVEDRMPRICDNFHPCDSAEKIYPVKGELVTAKRSDGSGKQYSTLTDEDGSYKLRIPAGRYNISTDYAHSRLVEVDGRKVSRVRFVFYVY